MVYKNRVYIEQLGCAANRADGNKICDYLIENDCSMTPPESADIVIVMSCGFSLYQQEETTEKIRQIRKKMRSDADIWIGGCVPSINPKLTQSLAVDHSFGPRSLEEIDNLVDSDVGIGSFIAKSQYPEITKLRDNIRIIRVSNGCLDKCSYCLIRKASGKLQSRTVKEIIEEVGVAASNGVSVCQLVGEDLGCYGRDLGTDLLYLCNSINEKYPNMIVLLSSVHPRYFVNNPEFYIELLSLQCMGKRFSLPVQSGSDRILSMMNRNYSINEYVDAVSSLKTAIPECEIATDFIVGFPTETDEEFEKSRALLKQIDFEYVDCFKFDALEGADILNTNYDDVAQDVKLHRLKSLIADATRAYFRRKGIKTIDDIKRFVEDPITVLPINTNTDMKT